MLLKDSLWSEMPYAQMLTRVLKMSCLVHLCKVPGRIGDACVAGGAAYADNDVGGCGSTGDGDLHLRFQPCYQVMLFS